MTWKAVNSLKTMIMRLTQLARLNFSSVQKAYETVTFEVSSADIIFM
jgi:hypothetical protein